jgi:hypothetical protein
MIEKSSEQFPSRARQAVLGILEDLGQLAANRADTLAEDDPELAE